MEEIFVQSKRFKVRVSNLGNIIGIRGNVLKPCKYGKRGYPPYFGVDVRDISTGKINKTYPIHRLVAEEFLPEWDINMQVNHIDGDKANNAASNLEMVNQSGNQRHGNVTGVIPRTLSKNSIRYLTYEEAFKIRERLNAIEKVNGKFPAGTLVNLAEEFGVTRFQLKDISRNRYWSKVKI